MHAPVSSRFWLLPISIGLWRSGSSASVPNAQVQWDSYALLRVGDGRLHLAVTGDPPPDRAVRLVPPAVRGEANGEVVIRVGDC